MCARHVRRSNQEERTLPSLLCVHRGAQPRHYHSRDAATTSRAPPMLCGAPRLRVTVVTYLGSRGRSVDETCTYSGTQSAVVVRIRWNLSTL